MAWAILNPGGKRRRRVGRRAKGRRKRKLSAAARRRISYGARRRAYASRFRAGFGAGMKRCGALVAKAAHRRAPSSGTVAGFKIPSWASNPRHKRRRNPLWMPSYGYNPGVVQSVKESFSPKTWLDALPIVGGVVANGFISGAAAGVIPVDAVKSGYGKAGLQLATAGVTGLLTNMTPMTRKYTTPIVLGGVLGAVIQALRTVGYAPGFSGLKDWLTTRQPNIPAPIANPQLGGMRGMGCDSFAMAGMKGTGAGDEMGQRDWDAADQSGETF